MIANSLNKDCNLGCSARYITGPRETDDRRRLAALAESNTFYNQTKAGLHAGDLPFLVISLDLLSR